MKRKLKPVSWGIISAVLVFAAAVHAESPMPVFMSITPQAYFVKQIGGDRVEVQVMVSPGASPATYEPKPRQMAAIASARLYFSIDVPFEHTWLPKISAANPKMTVVPTDRNIQKMPPAGFHREDTPRKKASHHFHDRGDPHIWLSPSLVLLQGWNIQTALAKADPDHREEYADNYKSFVNEIVEVDLEIRRILSGKSRNEFMVFHPTWGYFAAEYGLKQIPIEIEGKDPKPAQLKALIEHARKHDIRTVFVQPQFSQNSARVIAKEIDGQVIPADPLAENWAENLKAVAKKLAETMR